MNLIASSSQSITCSIVEDSKQFYFSAIYGANDGIERRRLWRSLSSLNDNMGNEPWIIAGDFNVIAHPSESSNTHQEFTVDIREFISCLTQIAVLDHPYAETMLTWSNQQTKGF